MIHLDNWQKEILEYDGDLLLCTGRRVGKTYILARKAMDYMATHRNTPVIIISLTEDQAMIIMVMALNYAKEMYPRLIGRGKERPTLRSMVLNGGKMIVRPVGNSGDGARGFEGGILIVDEAARMPKLFWISALPILLTTNGRIWISSTPFGKQGYFWERFNEAYNLKDPKARFKVFYISTEEVMKNREICFSWSEEQRAGALRILEEDKKTMSALEYGQEYLGLFTEDLQSLFSEELIERICCLKRGRATTGKNYLGVDVAGLGEDLSTFEVICKISDDNLEQKENQVMEKAYTGQVIEKIGGLSLIYNVKKIGVDDGGVGFGVYSGLLQNHKTKKKTIALNNASRATDSNDEKHKKILKEEMYFRLLTYMENNKIKLLDDDNIKASLKSIQWEIIQKEEDKPKTRIFGRDSHIVEGIIRAVWLATEDKTLNIWCAFN
jgi:hypothetical protein